MTKRAIRISGNRHLVVTDVYDLYWFFAYARQDIFYRRVAGEDPPWTTNPIFNRYRFCNVYRVSDRVSQYLIRHVIYEGIQSPEEILFRIMLFRVFNKIETWEWLVSQHGELTWKTFSYQLYARSLDLLKVYGEPVYNHAYILPCPNIDNLRCKHHAHLRLLEQSMLGELPMLVYTADTFETLYRRIHAIPSFGPFLAFQLAIDINYSPICNFSENDYVVAGLGAKDGIRKCFTDIGDLSEADIIKVVCDRAEEEFHSRGLLWKGLWGRPLQLIDCQNLFCEIGKYSRASHPAFKGMLKRVRIKNRYRPKPFPVPQWYPPKWGLVPDPTNMMRQGSAGYLHEQLAPRSA